MSARTNTLHFPYGRCPRVKAITLPSSTRHAAATARWTASRRCYTSTVPHHLPPSSAGAVQSRTLAAQRHSVRSGHQRVWRRNESDATLRDADDSASSQIFIALGSNMGDRVAAIESACRTMDATSDMRIVETSPLYETMPMYVENQERFVNGVCRIETNLTPLQLLDRLQSIEKELGRVKFIDKGPRNIDLDILTYNHEHIQSDRLTVPHRLMLEREFVLRPLCDTTGRNFSHPVTRLPLKEHLDMLPPSPTPMYPLTPLGPSNHVIRALDPTRRTLIMSILNVTPDSFSDGGIHRPTDFAALQATAAAHIAAGASIIDIGGQSSRPNAPDVTAQEEISRVLPAIAAIRSLPTAGSVTISVDTYRAAVAKAAVDAGAHMVNDISAGTLDPAMLSTVASLGCTYAMMHMRGDPSTMQSTAHTTYPSGALLPTLAGELDARLNAANAAGIRAWRILLDPGLGFAKTHAQNLSLLRDLSRLRHLHSPALAPYPWLVGSSRKAFVGTAAGGVRDPRDRIPGTAVTVAAAIAGGADVVRVHDVAEMAQAVRVADAIYRGLPPDGKHFGREGG